MLSEAKSRSSETYSLVFDAQIKTGRLLFIKTTHPLRHAHLQIEQGLVKTLAGDKQNTSVARLVSSSPPGRCEKHSTESPAVKQRLKCKANKGKRRRT